MTMQIVTNPEPGDAGASLRIDRASYLSSLLNQRQPLIGDVAELQALRDRAVSIAHELAIPSTRDEEWRFTNLAPLVETSFQAVSHQHPISLRDLEPFILPEASIRLVVVDGVLVPELSIGTEVSDRLIASDLSGLTAAHPVINYLAKQSGAEEVFTVLNTACFQTAAVIWLKKQQAIAAPIHLLFVSTGNAVATVSYPRCLVVAESGSQGTIVEEYVSLSPQPHFTNAVTELWIGDGAQVSHALLQRNNSAAIHIGKTAVSQARDSSYACNAISLGSKLARHNLEVTLTGEQTTTTLNGLTMISGDQLADTHSAINFTKPHGSSRQVHKCIVDDRAHAVFNGKVFVPKAAQMTDAGQLSRTLLLSPKARVDTKPQLEIIADNVKCSHGATVSQVDADEIFYLQSRGLEHSTAQTLLVYAFAAEILDQLPVPSLGETLKQQMRWQQDRQLPMIPT
jgi:Fe-S cluster assembly protein SufD